ncbi:hypothetical protein, partial [Rhodovulum sulfidophilum]
RHRRAGRLRHEGRKGRCLTSTSFRPEICTCQRSVDTATLGPSRQYEPSREDAMTAEKRALNYLRALEAEGRVVKRVVIEGRRIEFELETEQEVLSEFDRVDMRYDEARAS